MYQHPPQQPYGQQGYQQPGYGQPNYGHHAPAPAYGNPALDALNQKALVWMIVGIGGLMAGFGMVTGPLCWVMGSKLKKEYMGMGAPVHGYATAAYWIGVATSVLMIFVFLMIFMMFVVFAGAAAAGA